MEKNKNGLIIMTHDGQFLEINNYFNPVEIGQEIDVKSSFSQKAKVFRRISSIAAAIILFLSGGYGVFGYHTVYGYVDVDINPSVELSYNLYKRVIGIKGLNEDGENIITHVKDYKNKPIEVVVNKVIDSAIKENYIKENSENAVLVTIAESKSLIDDSKILEEINTRIKDSSIEAEVVFIKSDKKSYEETKNDSKSPGKAKLIEKAVEENKNINPSEIKDKSVKEIMNIIKESNKENKENKEAAKKLDKEAKNKEKEKKEVEKNIRKEEKEADKREKNQNKSNNKEKEKNKYDNNKNDKKENKSKEKLKENKRNNTDNSSNQSSNNKNKENNKKNEDNRNNNKSKDKKTPSNSRGDSKNNPNNRR